MLQLVWLRRCWRSSRPFHCTSAVWFLGTKFGGNHDNPCRSLRWINGKTLFFGGSCRSVRQNGWKCLERKPSEWSLRWFSWTWTWLYVMYVYVAFQGCFITKGERKNIWNPLKVAFLVFQPPIRGCKEANSCCSILGVTQRPMWLRSTVFNLCGWDGTILPTYIDIDLSCGLEDHVKSS